MKNQIRSQYVSTLSMKDTITSCCWPLQKRQTQSLVWVAEERGQENVGLNRSRVSQPISAYSTPFVTFALNTNQMNTKQRRQSGDFSGVNTPQGVTSV